MLCLFTTKQDVGEEKVNLKYEVAQTLELLEKVLSYIFEYYSFLSTNNYAAYRKDEPQNFENFF